MAQLNPYISFNGRCEEAMNFYKKCFGGELLLMKVKDTPVAAQCGAGMENQVMHSSLTRNGFVLMGTDMVGGGNYTQGNNFSVSVNCESEEEINQLFSSLSEEGQVVEPVKQQFWGDLFGVLVDKFGIPWMFNYASNKN
jgi:PhnB protein